MDDNIRLVLDENSLRQTVAVLESIGKGIYNSPEVKSGLRRAGDYLINKGKSRLGSRSTTVSKAFKRTLKKKNYGVMSGFNKEKATVGDIPGKMVFLPAIIDSGTKMRRTKKGANRGQIKGNGFWSDTREQDSAQATKIVFDAVYAGVEKLMNR